jgi:hypothetical protein
VKQAARVRAGHAGPGCRAGRAVHLRQHPRHRGRHLQWRRRGAARGRTEGDWLDAVVAGEPNVLADRPRRARAVRLHHRSRAADAVRPAGAAGRPRRSRRCCPMPAVRGTLAAQGVMLAGADLKAQAAGALAKLHAKRLDRRSAACRRDQRRLRPVARGGRGLCLGLWPLRRDAHPCGFAFGAEPGPSAARRPRPPNAQHGGPMPAAFRRARASASSIRSWHRRTWFDRPAVPAPRCGPATARMRNACRPASPPPAPACRAPACR